MSENKFTPGPWQVGMNSGRNANTVYDKNDNPICLVYGIFSNCDIDETKECTGTGNAHLSAAAPELLMALEDIINSVATVEWKYSTSGKYLLYKSAIKAIAKAKGES